MRLPHNGPAKLRGSASEPSLHKTSSRHRIPSIVLKGGVGRYATESLGPGKFRWSIVEAPKEPIPKGMHAENRPSKVALGQMHSDGIDPARDALEKSYQNLGYRPGQPRREKMRSILGEIIPAEWKAYGTPMVPDLPVVEGRQKVALEVGKDPDDTPTDELFHQGKNCRIQTLPDLRVLSFRPGGERLVLRRWQSGYCLMPGPRQVPFSRDAEEKVEVEGFFIPPSSSSIVE